MKIVSLRNGDDSVNNSSCGLIVYQITTIPSWHNFHIKDAVRYSLCIPYQCVASVISMQQANNSITLYYICFRRFLESSRDDTVFHAGISETDVDSLSIEERLLGALRFVSACMESKTLYTASTVKQKPSLLTTKPTKWRAPSEDSDQSGHSPSLIRVFPVRTKKDWVLRYPKRALQRLWSDWSGAQADLSLRWVHRSFCWFYHEAAQVFIRLHL